MSLLDELQFHSNENYLDIKEEENNETRFGMAVFGLGASSLLHEVRVEIEQELTLPDTDD